MICLVVSESDCPADTFPLCIVKPLTIFVWTFSKDVEGERFLYTWSGKENLEQTIARLFSEPFGQGYPKDERERKIGDANLLKRIRAQSQVGFVDLLHTLDNDLIQKIMTKKDVVDFVFAEGADPELRQWLREHGLSRPISDVVAGKIDVRGVDVPEFAPAEEETGEKEIVLAKEEANEQA